MRHRFGPEASSTLARLRSDRRPGPLASPRRLRVCAEREEDASQSFCSVTDPRGTPACLRPSRPLLHRVEASSGDDTCSMLSRAARPPLSRPPRATVSRSSCSRADGFPPTRVALVEQPGRGDLSPGCFPRLPFGLRFHRPGTISPAIHMRAFAAHALVTTCGFTHEWPTDLFRHPRHQPDDLRGWVIPSIVPTVQTFPRVQDTASDRVSFTTDTKRAGAPLATRAGKPTREAPFLPPPRRARDGSISASEARPDEQCPSEPQHLGSFCDRKARTAC